MKLTYSTLRKSYRASRALVQAKSAKIEDLLKVYRLQALGRALPRVDEITQLRAWTDREAKWALDEGHLGITVTPTKLRDKNDALFAVMSSQNHLIELLLTVTRPNGNGFSSVQNYAQMEHGKATASFGRFREAAKRRTEEEARIASEKLLTERSAYRSWRIEEVLGRNRGGASRNRS